jgi:hypothetical protein
MTDAEKYAEFMNKRRDDATPIWLGIPLHMQDALAGYLLYGQRVGHFLTALLSNDLKEAVARADDTNVTHFREYMMFLYNRAPSDCFGSPQAHAAWLAQGGLMGREQE